MIRTYSELKTLKTFDERYEYLKLNGNVADVTFGFDRYINQKFYHSDLWKKIRRKIISRDLGCDLAVQGYDIKGKILIHHMNPIEIKDIVNITEYLINPEYLITVCLQTHNAIHYGNMMNNPNVLIERRPGDTCPWKR